MAVVSGVSAGQPRTSHTIPESLLSGTLYETAAFQIPKKHKIIINRFNTLLDMSLPDDRPSIYGLAGKFLLHRSEHEEGLVVVRSVIHAARGALPHGTGRSISTIRSGDELFGEAHSFVAAQEGQPRPLTPIHYAKLTMLTRILRETRVVELVRLS